ncbi:all trans-polyprenyl-diphosphate synthase PDSS1 isoform X1 [Drosophila gunungcola]|uniref:all trans-polyprenyl-diphosphate synthase PDSS1 isoform X1 n=1 Tax=Drosophila gunungcola TaxID=103775 RepID=UPI0022E94181|nr:all trans-polyprenyl-diphosphate synthase PDSS1 isoform X1 [Drosophila gunungcola]
MACLSTSGRVVCVSRRQQTHKLLYQLFGSRPGLTNPSPSTGFNPPKVQLQAMRLFHGLSFSMGKDYPDLLQSPHKCSNSLKYSQCSKANVRQHSSVHTQQPAGPVREFQIDPYIILDDDLKYFYDDVRYLLKSGTSQPELDTIASYYFDGQGKALRPMVTMLMAKAINYHLNNESHQLVHKQRQIALFSEMVHSASLVHDDVIDQSDFRRGKPSVNALWNHKKVTMAGDYILSIASIMIARLRSDDVTIVLSQILTDLVQGEFMQLGSRETENERFAHYLTKTYRKTASLIANALKATAVIAQADDNVAEVAFQYGRNIGLAFQLVDDMLDFVSSTEQMGKPTAADLKLGLATAPVLFACEKYPELNPMVMRRFSEPGDVERAFELVHKSHGLEQTRFLAKKHCNEAIRLAQELTESPYQKGLQVVADLVINRMK